MPRNADGRWGPLLAAVRGPPSPVMSAADERPTDYHPLSREEVRFLLGVNDVAHRGGDADEAAGDRSWVGIITGVPVRLARAVPGNLYGGARDGVFWGDVSFLLGQLYHEYLEAGDVLPHLDELVSILANERPNFGALSPSLATRLGRPEHAGRRVRYVHGTDIRGEYGAVVRFADPEGDDWITAERDTKVSIGPDGIIPET